MRLSRWGGIISDGALFFHPVDAAVDPAHQGNGLGKAIVAALWHMCERSRLPKRMYCWWQTMRHIGCTGLSASLLSSLKQAS